MQGTHPLNILLMRYGFALAGLLVILLMQFIISTDKAKQYVSLNWSAAKASPKVYLLTGLVSALVMATYVMGTLLFGRPKRGDALHRHHLPAVHRKDYTPILHPQP